MGGLRRYLINKSKENVISQLKEASKKYCQTLLEIGTEYTNKPLDCLEPKDDPPLPQSMMFYLLLYVCTI